MTKYPNLVELLRYYPCGIPAVCKHAEIEPELLAAVLDGTEVLTPVEIMGLARLYKCPVGVLNYPEVIMLDKYRWRHMQMILEADRIYMRLRAMAGAGNERAAGYIKHVKWKWQKFLRAVYEGKLSYCHYLGAKESFLQCVRWSTPAPERRSLTRTVTGWI